MVFWSFWWLQGYFSHFGSISLIYFFGENFGYFRSSRLFWWFWWLNVYFDNFEYFKGILVILDVSSDVLVIWEILVAFWSFWTFYGGNLVILVRGCVTNPPNLMPWISFYGLVGWVGSYIYGWFWFDIFSNSTNLTEPPPPSPQFFLEY